MDNAECETELMSTVEEPKVRAAWERPTLERLAAQQAEYNVNGVSIDAAFATS